jgi:hypothetical protein
MKRHYHFFVTCVAKPAVSLLFLLLAFGASPTVLLAQVGQTCASYIGGTVNVPDNTPGVYTSIGATLTGIPAGATITDIEVTAGISTTWVGDLQIYVETPNGEVVVLAARPGATTTPGAGDPSDLNANSPIRFNDSASESLAAAAVSLTTGVICQDPPNSCDFFPFANPNVSLVPPRGTLEW